MSDDHLTADVPLPEPPVDPQDKPQTLVYMPLPYDPDETEVAGIKFKAYELTELPEGKAWLAGKYAINAWFAPSLDAVDPTRKADWEKAREAK